MTTNVLKLTGIIHPGYTKGVFVGKIKEIEGIFSQGNTPEEAFNNLVETTEFMLLHKRAEAERLLKEQNAPVRSLPTEIGLSEPVPFKLIQELHEAG